VQYTTATPPYVNLYFPPRHAHFSIPNVNFDNLMSRSATFCSGKRCPVFGSPKEVDQRFQTAIPA
jgi:hypothetical protein